VEAYVALQKRSLRSWGVSWNSRFFRYCNVLVELAVRSLMSSLIAVIVSDRVRGSRESRPCAGGLWVTSSGVGVAPTGVAHSGGNACHVLLLKTSRLEAV
jgi:hypothetical protein